MLVIEFYIMDLGSTETSQLAQFGRAIVLLTIGRGFKSLTENFFSLKNQVFLTKM